MSVSIEIIRDDLQETERGLVISDYIASHFFYLTGGPPVEPEEEWAKMNEKVTRELDIDTYQIKDIKEEAEEKLIQEETC